MQVCVSLCVCVCACTLIVSGDFFFSIPIQRKEVQMDRPASDWHLLSHPAGSGRVCRDRQWIGRTICPGGGRSGRVRAVSPPSTNRGAGGGAVWVGASSVLTARSPSSETTGLSTRDCASSWPTLRPRSSNSNWSDSGRTWGPWP